MRCHATFTQINLIITLASHSGRKAGSAPRKFFLQVQIYGRVVHKSGCRSAAAQLSTSGPFTNRVLRRASARMPFDAQLVGTCLASLVVGALLATVLRPSPGPRSVSKPPSEDVPDSKVEESEEEDESADDIGPCKMILVVRMDLKMGKGKIAAQVP